MLSCILYIQQYGQFYGCLCPAVLRGNLHQGGGVVETSQQLDFWLDLHSAKHTSSDTTTCSQAVLPAAALWFHAAVSLIEIFMFPFSLLFLLV